MQGYIHSLQSMGTVDGPGVRAVVFSSGCPLRCAYCHNPDTWEPDGGELTDCAALAEKIIRFYPYIKNGGVTFSGGEPLLSAEFFFELSLLLKKKGLHIAIDTCGHAKGEAADRLLALCDLVLLDIKFTNEEDYKKYTGGSLKITLDFLKKLQNMGKPVWIRQVIVPGINDTEENILKLAEIAKNHKNVQKVELLPFKKLCLEKYKQLGIPFPLENVPQMDKEKLDIFDEKLQESFNL